MFFRLTGQVSKELFEKTLAGEKDNQWPILLARLQSLDKDSVSYEFFT